MEVFEPIPVVEQPDDTWNHRDTSSEALARFVMDRLAPLSDIEL